MRAIDCISGASTISPSNTAVSIGTIIGVVGVLLAIAQRIWWRRKYGKPDE